MLARFRILAALTMLMIEYEKLMNFGEKLLYRLFLEIWAINTT
jgi:hypothetical protein